MVLISRFMAQKNAVIILMSLPCVFVVNVGN